MKAIFFDIGETLASAKFSSTPPHRLQRFDVFSFVPDVLKKLKEDGFKLGIISNTGNETSDDVNAALGESGILIYFDPEILIYSNDIGLDKSTREIFDLAIERSGIDAESCFYVGENSNERSVALKTGMKTCPHVSLIENVINDEKLYYARITFENSDEYLQLLKEKNIIPLFVNRENADKILVYAIGGQISISSLLNTQIEVQVLREVDLQSASDLFLIRNNVTDPNNSSNMAKHIKFLADGAELLSSSEHGLLMSIKAEIEVGKYHCEHHIHGDILKLIPNLFLLENEKASSKQSFLPNSEDFLNIVLSKEEQSILQSINESLIKKYHSKYCGDEPIDNNDNYIKSRHINAPNDQNQIAVSMIMDDLTQIFDGYTSFSAQLQRFTYSNKFLYNVEAELKGRNSNGVILVTAHLDSTSENLALAPGSDDDASGVSAVLSIAYVLKELFKDKQPEFGIKFVLFNAEEQGRIGSQVYARNQASQGVNILAVYQMDMIGYNVLPPRSWEVHAGYKPSQIIQERSRKLAETLKSVTSLVSPELEPPQIYISTESYQDPAERRSDHTSFHDYGYAACVSSGDFFAGPDPNSPEAEGNPNYHKSTDTYIDKEYTADIARAIAATVYINAK